jgi:hypothetical protein
MGEGIRGGVYATTHGCRVGLELLLFFQKEEGHSFLVVQDYTVLVPYIYAYMTTVVSQSLPRENMVSFLLLMYDTIVLYFKLLFGACEKEDF